MTRGLSFMQQWQADEIEKARLMDEADRRAAEHLAIWRAYVDARNAETLEREGPSPWLTWALVGVIVAGAWMTGPVVLALMEVF